MKRAIVISLGFLLLISCRSVQRSTQKNLDLRSEWIQTSLDTDMKELRTLELGTMEYREIREVETFDTLGRITQRTRTTVENIETNKKVDEQILSTESFSESYEITELSKEEKSEVSRKFNLGSLLIWLALFLVATFVFRFVRKGSLL